MTTATRKTFSTGLSSETQSFTIDGLVYKNNKTPQYVLATIAFLERGLPTVLTKSLELKLINLIGSDRYKAAFDIMNDPLISDQECDWSRTIKGHDETERFPARTFYSKLLPEALSDTPYSAQQFLPEVPIADIITDLRPADGIAKGEAVDFFCPHFRLVVEIDGGQHQRDEISTHDSLRDEVFHLRKINTKRIPASWIDSNSEKKERLSAYFKKHTEKDRYKVKAYSQDSEVYADKISIISAARIQRVIIELVRSGQISTNVNNWNINLDADDTVNTEILEVAVGALINLMKDFAALYSERFNKPTRHDLLRSTNKATSLTIDYSATLIFDDRLKSDGSIRVRNNLLNHQYNLSDTTPRDYTNTNGDFGKKIVLNSKNKVAALENLLHEMYGYDGFQKGQYEIIQSAFENQAVLGLLPTGAGKSLTFQLPGILASGCTIVVCPITALIRDHMFELNEIGFSGRTEYISAVVTPQKRAQIFKKLSGGTLRYLFVSPEQFQNALFRAFVKSAADANVISKFVIDEVHCLSEWGHDFRVAYLTLSKTLHKLAPAVSILCLTATASKSVMRDIQIEFDIDEQNIRG